MSTYNFGGFDDIFGGINLGGPNNAILTAVLIIAGVSILIALLFGLLMYIFQSLGLFTMAKRRGIGAPGLAWVPIANVWTLGSLADQYERKASGKDKRYRKKLLGLSIASALIALPFAITCMVLAVQSVMTGSDFDFGIASGSFIFVLITYIAILVISVLYSVFSYIALYKVYRSCKPGTSVLLLILSIFFNVIPPFALFALRKHDGGYEEIRRKEMSGQGNEA